MIKLTDFIAKPIGLAPIGVYRIGLGVVMAAQLIIWAPHWTELFSDAGFHIGPLADWAPSPTVCFGLGITLAASTLLMTAGLFTRAATAVTLIIFGFLHGIDTINERALTTIILVNLTIGLFSPWGDYFSLSAWHKRRRGIPTAEKLGNPIHVRLWQIQLLQMYFFSGVMKTMYPTWFDGKVLSQIFMGRWSRPTGLWLSKTLPDAVYPFLTIGAFTFEMALPFLLLWSKTRRIGVVLGILFHLSIEATLYIEFLGFYSILCLIVFFWLIPSKAQPHPSQ